MSWLDKLNNSKLEIITGDGESYFPLWQEAENEVRYNTESYNFKNISGTYIARELKQGDQFPIKILFTGESNIEDSKQFKASANDPRPWTIKHPYYDDLLVQPLSLRFNNKDHNATEITGTVWETLPSKYPEISTNAEADIKERKSNTDELSKDVALEAIQTPETGAVGPAKLSVDFLGKLYEILGNAEKLNDLIRTARGAALNLISKPAEYLNAIQALIDFPLSVENNVIFSLRQIKQAVNDLFNILDLSYYDQQSATLLTTACLASISFEFETRKQINEASQIIIEIYDFIVLSFDNADYEQNDQIALNTYAIVNLTIQQLFKNSFNAKQERFYIVDKDENILNLVHRFLGFSDENLVKFQEWNNLSIDEVLSIKKGREIVYYK